MNTGRLTINRVNSGRFAQSYLKVSSAESRAGWNGPKNIFPCLTIWDFNNFRFEWHFKNFSFYFDFEKICPQADSKRYDVQKCQKSDRFLQGRKILAGIAVWCPLRPPPPPPLRAGGPSDLWFLKTQKAFRSKCKRFLLVWHLMTSSFHKLRTS